MGGYIEPTPEQVAAHQETQRQIVDALNRAMAAPRTQVQWFHSVQPDGGKPTEKTEAN